MVLMVDVIDFTGSAHFIVLGLLSHSSHTFYILGATVVGGKEDYMQLRSLMLEGSPAATAGKRRF